MECLPKVYLYRRVLNAKLFIDANFDQSIDLDIIAGEAYFSKFHFIRIFKKVYGKTPHQYLIWVRLQKAGLLLQTGLSIPNVCFAIGFESVSTFTTLFKASFATTPGTYQQQQIARLQEMKEAPLKFIPNCFAQKNGWINK
ncbi:AraC family transcriptional regulator [Mucilaginibacter terrenus]|uniref:AraC family transcriptional regulator n=1 Tax=Mucilaginibacter terrenus TaxID=2482727 RepID=A0A3E2NJL2_9SPHI|nr:AraC family transcriptional regulator [Mucilaginibacter terrenus]RFZ81120.1 AraC family transcriptional regulator [Mucilaginibacter terrenus]